MQSVYRQSVRLIALGLPPDSVCIWYKTCPARDCGRPSIFRTAATSLAHWATPAPYDPVYFPVPPAPPPPPPPLGGAAAATIAFHAAPSMAAMIFTGALTIVAANAPCAPPLPLLPSMFSRALANAFELPDATAAASLARSAAPPATSLTRPLIAVIGFRSE